MMVLHLNSYDWFCARMHESPFAVPIDEELVQGDQER